MPDPAIYGGEFAENRLAAFIDAWGLPRADMPWHIWEQVDIVGMTDRPSDMDLVERARVFGKAGDLSLRREGKCFLWHFVGRRAVPPPEGFDSRNFWDFNDQVNLTQRESSVLLWGRRGANGVRRDDRVARATLAYPGLELADSVRVSCRTYSTGGQIVAIWWQGLEADK